MLSSNLKSPQPQRKHHDQTLSTASSTFPLGHIGLPCPQQPTHYPPTANKRSNNRRYCSNNLASHGTCGAGWWLRLWCCCGTYFVLLLSKSYDIGSCNEKGRKYQKDRERFWRTTSTAICSIMYLKKPNADRITYLNLFSKWVSKSADEPIVDISFYSGRTRSLWLFIPLMVPWIAFERRRLLGTELIMMTHHIYCFAYVLHFCTWV